MTGRYEPGTGSGPDGGATPDRLARLYSHYIDRLIAGETLDGTGILAEHPDVGPELLRKLEAFRDLGGDGQEEECFRVLGDYHLLRRVGRGGMGVVYEAWQSSVDRRVALKVLPAGLAADNKAFLRFMREARAAARLSHQNVVSVYGMGIESDTPYYSMEFVEGRTLEDVLASLCVGEDRRTGVERKGALLEVSDLLDGREARPEEAAAGGAPGPDLPSPERGAPGGGAYLTYCRSLARAAAGIADGLQHAHEKGIIHRDIKPSNLILDRTGRLRILDFGLARLPGQETLTGSGDFIGTPLYMSPEQARARKAPLDHRTDVYSLGATLYQLLVWRPPFQGRDHQDTLSQIVSLDPRSPRSLNPELPQDLENIVLKCMRKEPAGRYGTAEALAQDLRRFARGDPVEARPQPVWEKLLRRLKRQRLRLLAALSLLLFLLGAGVLFHDLRRERLALHQKRYRDLVLEAAMLIQMGEMTMNAGSSREGALDPQDLFSKGDFQTLAAEAGLNPLEDALLKLGRARALLQDAALEKAPGFIPARILIEEAPGRAGERSPGPAGEPPAGREGWEGLWLRAHEAARRRDWKEAAELYAKLLEEASASGEPYLGSSVEFCMERGRVLLEGGRASEAIETFISARTLWPAAKVPDLLLGKAYYQNGQKDDAERTFQALHARVEGFRDEVALWVAAIYKYFREYQRGLDWSARLEDGALRARLHVEFLNCLGRYAEAAQHGREAVIRFPEDAGLQFSYAAALLIGRICSPKEMVEAARRARDLDPRRVDTLCLLAAAQFRNEEPATAEETYLEAIRIAPEEPRAYTELGKVLFKSGRKREALERCRQGAALYERRPRAYHFRPYDELGRILYTQGRLVEATQAWRRALELHTNVPDVASNLGMVLKRLGGDYEEAKTWLRKSIETGRPNADGHRQLGLIEARLGRFPEAVAQFREAVRFAPQDLVAAQDLAWALEEDGKPEDAFQVFLEAMKRNPGRHDLDRWLIHLEEREGAGGRFSEGWDEVAQLLEEGFDARSSPPEAVHLLAAALAHGRSRRDLDRAHQLAALAVERARRRIPEFVATLAWIELQRGQTAEAVRWLERVQGVTGARRTHLRLLAECRSCLLPNLVSFASADAEIAHRGGTPEAVSGIIRGFSSLAEEERAPGLLPYLEGALLEGEGRLGEAIEKLRDAWRISGDERQLISRLAALERKAGRPEQAEAALRSSLQDGLGEDSKTWNLWAAVCFVDLRRSPAEVLASFPSSTTRAAVELRWLLERLSSSEAVRINCGGDEYRGTDGVIWAADRFFRRGWHLPRADFEITGTEDDPLYCTARAFPEEEPTGGYRLPLPPGRYRVALHFAETSLKDRYPRAEDVSIEDQPVLAGYDPLKAGFAAADRKTYEVEVADGVLDIEVVPRREAALLSALEVEQIRP